MSHAAFALLARPIQQILWEMRWESLRPIQEAAIHEILEGDRDLIISAQTAAGKTEAAFLPILSVLYERPQPSIQALYVGPLKALINDQFRRLEDLCCRVEIPVNRWHGDVAAVKKRKLLGAPGGVLLITPESIESLFVNHSSSVQRIFKHLQFVVIDELHSFVGRERGTHLRSLLFRIRRVSGLDFRLIGLSATLGNGLPDYCEWMRPGQSERVRQVSAPSGRKEVLFRLQATLAGSLAERRSDCADLDETAVPDQIVRDIHAAFAGTRNLLFANSRANVERFVDALNERCQEMGTPAEFLVHHGSLSKEIREHTEELMRAARPYTTVCSSTLELGIDIGQVAAVGQIGAPWSVSSLVQRLGRSGRKEGEPHVMRLYFVEGQTDTDSDLVDRLRPELLCGVALTELMIQRWVEPPQIPKLDLSTLTHQVLSVLAQTGGVTAETLFEVLAAEGAFREVDDRLFVALLRSLGQHGVVEQVPSGEIILAPKGEAIVRHHSFYCAFATPFEYAVVFEGRTVGQLPSLGLPEEGQHLLLAGRRWMVIHVDHASCVIFVSPARGKKAPCFTGETGEVHSKVRQTMREVLFSDEPYTYLDPTAAQLLQRAREYAQRASLASRPFVELSDSHCYWLTWTGTRQQRTLCLMVQHLGIEAADVGIAIRFRAPVADVTAAYASLLEPPPSAEVLAQAMLCKCLRKFDHLVAEPLLVRSLAHDFIDLAGACAVVRRDIGAK